MASGQPPNNGDNVKSQAVRWLLGQEATTIILVLILVGLGWFGKYCVDVAIPAHLKQIQVGYELVTSKHNDEVKELRETYEKSSERTERLLREIFQEQKSQGRLRMDRGSKPFGDLEKSGDGVGSVTPVPLGDGT